jgi:hypothetical protein
LKWRGFWRVGIRVGLSRRIFRVVEEPSAWESSWVRTLAGACLVGSCCGRILVGSVFATLEPGWCLAYRVVAVTRTYARSVSLGGFGSGAEHRKSERGGACGQCAGVEVRVLIAGPKS